MEAWRPYYEQQLALLRQRCQHLAGGQPRHAAGLALTAEPGDDPGLEWLLQASAFLNARLAQRLDTCYAGVAAALLELQQAHYLRPLPSGAVVQFDWRGLASGSVSAVSTVARGSELQARQGAAAGACRLRSVQDVHIVPLSIGELRFQPVFDAPAALRLPADAHSAISLRLDSLASGPELMPPGLSRLRLFPDGGAGLRAALRDSLLLHCVACYVESAGRWRRLASNPLTPVAPEAGHLPPTPGDDPACRLLSEYFAYPDSFDFCDLDLAAVAAALSPCATGAALASTASLAGAAAEQSVGRSLRVHWVLRDLRQRPSFRLLRGLAPEHLRLGCTPVVNLFPASAEPLRLALGETSAPLRPSRASPESCQVYCVEQVGLLRQVDAVSATSLPSDRARLAAGGPGWQLQRADAMLAAVDGCAFRLVLRDRERRPLALPDDEALSVQLLCTDGALASTLAPGQPSGELSCEMGGVSLPIRLLRRPSAFRPAAMDPAAHWEAIAGLAPHPAMLSRDGWPALLSLLRCHVAADDVQGQRLLAGLGAFESRPLTLWRTGQPWHGLALHLNVDQAVFAERSLHTFAQVLNRFLARYIHTHSFVRLHLRDQISKMELLRCPPCPGSLPLA